ncbi:hypothetical protein SRCM101294_03919 [Bacillus amyloliquefaciens]|nr:hypothetical protein SRCM101294_03919 [Bacillus amyloliquefaciens]
MSLPTFQYSPNPVALNVFNKEEATCLYVSKNVNTYMKVISILTCLTLILCR